MIDQGLKPRSNVLSLKVIPADAALAEHLQIDEKDPVNELVRIRFADDEALQYETSYIPWKYAPGLVDDDCQGSFFQLLRSKYSIQIDRTIDSIESVLATETISMHLNIPPGAPVFSIETITYNSENIPVEYFLKEDLSSRTVLFYALGSARIQNTTILL